jgi:enoyl-CoA hydratase/carnithine racemase
MSSSDDAAGEVELEELDAALALVTLKRPRKLNALTHTMVAQLEGHVASLNAKDEIRAVVFTGSERAFCVGSDINELASYASPWAFGSRRDYCDIIRGLRVPSIAAINGYTFGGGLELALSCDIRVAAASATFAAPEIKLGWVGGSGQCALLSHNIGPSNAAHMVLTGEPIDAGTALRWGLVTKVTEDTELLSSALQLATVIASLAPLAARAAKIDLRSAYSMPLPEAVSLERHLQTICFATKDAAEGQLAFIEGRTPIFEGH